MDSLHYQISHNKKYRNKVYWIHKYMCIDVVILLQLVHSQESRSIRLLYSRSLYIVVFMQQLFSRYVFFPGSLLHFVNLLSLSLSA